MATLRQKIQAEQKVRELLEQSDIPEPDAVEYGYGCIRLFFDAPKVVLVVDIDDPPEGAEPPKGINLSDHELISDGDDGEEFDDAA